MAFIVDRSQQSRVSRGQAGRFRYEVSGHFSTTDATGTIPVPLKNITYLSTPIFLAQPGSNEEVYFAESTHLSKGVLAVNSGVITIGRINAATSGLPVMFVIEGF